MSELLERLSSAPPTDWTRLLLVYLHLLFCVFSLALVLSADWHIVRGNFTRRSMQKTAHQTGLLLACLWITGALLLHHDTRLDLVMMAQMSKLQLKIAVVTALTINGVLLHFVSFPLASKRRRLTLGESLILSITGAISTSHWLLAAFVGMARPLAQWPVQTLLTLYALYVALSMVLATICTPFIRRKLLERLRQSRPQSDSTPQPRPARPRQSDEWHHEASRQPVDKMPV